MNTTMTRLFALGFACVGLMACSTTPGAAPDDFGDAVRANIALHTINAAGTQDPELVFDGERRALMLDRYALDKVDAPGSARTSDISTASDPS